MTTIRSRAVDGERTLDVIRRYDGLVNLQISIGTSSDLGGVGIQVRGFELLEALDAVPKDSSWGELREIAGKLSQELRDERARAEAAEAKLERVREFREWLSRPTAYATKAAVIRHLDDALADPTPFELPTEAGARFEARHGGNDTTDEFLTVNCDGKPLYLRLASSCIYGPESVLGCFGHFRLIEADE